MSESVPSRDIELADTYNLRDLGGYPTVDGRRVAWRRLFRGASLQRLGGEDAAVVGALGLRTRGRGAPVSRAPLAVVAAEERLLALADPWKTAEAFGIESMIDPRETREVAAAFLNASLGALRSRLGPQQRRWSMRP